MRPSESADPASACSAAVSTREQDQTAARPRVGHPPQAGANANDRITCRTKLTYVWMKSAGINTACMHGHFVFCPAPPPQSPTLK